MAAPLRQELLKRFIWGLKLYAKNFRDVNFMERRLAIKQAADAAMASAADGAIWSRALVFKISSLQGENPVPRKHEFDCTTRPSSKTKHRILRRQRIYRRRQSNSKILKSMKAPILPNKQTKELRRLIPGGEYMNPISLLSETASYILSLKEQIYVMNHISNALGSSRDQERKIKGDHPGLVSGNAKGENYSCIPSEPV